MPRLRSNQTSCGALLNAPLAENGNPQPQQSQTRGLLEFLNSRFARASRSNSVSSDSTPAVTPVVNSASAHSDIGAVVLHLSYHGAMQTVRVVPSLVPDVASLRLLFASIFRLDNMAVRDQPVYMKVAVSSPLDQQQQSQSQQKRGALFKLVNQVNEIVNGAVLMLVDDRELLDSARSNQAIAPLHACAPIPAAGSRQRTPSCTAPNAGNACSGRCTCSCERELHHHQTIQQPQFSSNTNTLKVTQLRNGPGPKASSITGSSYNINDAGVPVSVSGSVPGSRTLQSSRVVGSSHCIGQSMSQPLPQPAQPIVPNAPAGTMNNVQLPNNCRVRAAPPSTLRGIAPRDLRTGTNGVTAHRETMRRVAERCRTVTEQIRGVRDELRDLRRCAITFRDEMNEQFAATQRELRSLLITVPGAQLAPLRRARYEVDVKFGNFARDEETALTDLADLKTVVDELRLQVVSNTAGARKDDAASVNGSDSGVSTESGSSQPASASSSSRPVLLNAVELEAYSLQLEKTVADLRVNKREFPGVMDQLKPVMLAETQQLVREEQFLKSHEKRLIEALQTSQQLATLLITLKRVCALQKFDRANSLLMAEADNHSGSHSRRPTLVTNPNPSHATKRAILENIQALCPNSVERVRAIEHNEALHRIRKRFMTSYANLQMEKLLRDKLAVANTTSKGKQPEPTETEPDAVDLIFQDVEKLVKQLDFVRLPSLDDDSDGDEVGDEKKQFKAGSLPPTRSEDDSQQGVARSVTSGNLTGALTKEGSESNSENSSQETVICNDLNFNLNIKASAVSNANDGNKQDDEKGGSKVKSGGKWRLLGRSKKKEAESEIAAAQVIGDAQDREERKKKESRRRSRSRSSSATRSTRKSTNDANNNNNNNKSNGLKRDAIAGKVSETDGLVFI